MTQQNQQRSSGSEPIRTNWRLPLLVFGGVAVSVSIAGSLLLFVVSLLTRDETPAAATEPRSDRAVAQQSSPVNASGEDTPPAESAPAEAGPSAEPAPAAHGPPGAPATTPTDEPPSSSETPPPPAMEAKPPEPVQPAVRPPADHKKTTPRETIRIGASRAVAAQEIPLEQFPTCELPGEAVGYAFDPQRGRLAVIGPWKDSVGFISAEDRRNGKLGEVKTVRLNGEPKAIAYKPLPDDGVFAVAHVDPHRLVIIDCESLEPLKTLKLENGPRCIAAASRADSPYIYVGTSPGSLRVDAARMEIETVWKENTFVDFATSPDGTRLYHRLGNRSLPDLTVAYPRPPVPGPRIFDKPMTRETMGFRDTGWKSFSREEDAWLYYPDPRGSWVAACGDVYSADLRTRLLELKYDVKAFLPDGPFVAGLRHDEFVIGSLNDGRTIAAVPLPDGWLGLPEEKRRRNPRMLGSSTLHISTRADVFSDQKQTEFVLGMRQRVVTFPLAAFDLPDETLLAVAEAPPAEAIVGEAYQFPIKTRVGSPEAALVESPEGMRIEDGVLHWTPTSEHIGETEVRIRLTEKDVSRDDAWQLTVRQNKLDVPFLVLGCDPSTDGKQLVVWGNDWTKAVGRDRLNPRFERHPGPRLAVVDLTTLEVVAEREFDEPILNAEFTNVGIFVATFTPQGSNESGKVFRVAADSLRSLGEVQIAAAQFFTTIADRFLIAWRPHEWSKRYQLPKLELVESTKKMRLGSGFGPMPNDRLGDGFLLDGVLWDDQLKQAHLLVHPAGFHGANRRSSPPLKDPHAALRGHVIAGPNRRIPRVDPWKPYEGTFTPHIPALLSVKRTNVRVHLDFTDLMSGEVVRSVTLRDGSWMTSSYPYDEGDHAIIKTTPEHVLVVHFGEVFVVPGEDATKPISMPFRIEPRQSSMVISANRSTSVTYVANDATQFDLELQCLNSTPSIEMTSADGQFEIDLGNVLADQVKQVSTAIQNDTSYGDNPAKRLNVYVREMREDYRQITGKDASGVPVTIRARVQAHSKDLSVAWLDHVYLIDIPSSHFQGYKPEPPSRRLAGRPTKPEPTPRSSPPQPRSELRTALDYSNYLRSRISPPPADLTIEKVTGDNAVLDGKFLAAFGPAEKREMRTWTDTTGRTVRAAFIERQDNVVVVIDPQGRTFRIPQERLCDADVKWVQQQPAATGSETSDPMQRIASSLKRLGTTFDAHAERHGSFPPAALVSDRGTPLLSWRVLVLPELGYTNLVRLFHYDEPWDSEHNRRLIPLMPAVFGGGPELAPGRTPYVAIVHPTGMVSDRYAIRPADIKDAKDQTLLFVEAASEVARIWTQPRDLAFQSIPQLDRMLAIRDGFSSIVLANGVGGGVPIGMTEIEWKKLVSIRDGMGRKAE